MNQNMNPWPRNIVMKEQIPSFQVCVRKHEWQIILYTVRGSWSLYWLRGIDGLTGTEQTDGRTDINRKLDRKIAREIRIYRLQWRHNERDGVSNHQPHHCLLRRLFKAQLKENIKAPRHWTLWGEFTDDRWIPRTKDSDAENVSIWWRHHEIQLWKRSSDNPHMIPMG